MLSNEIFEVEARQWDWKSPFGSTPAFAARQSWGKQWGEGTPVALLYSRNIEAGETKIKFSGYAEPLGEHTLEEIEEKYLIQLTEQVIQQKAADEAAALAAATPTAEERIAAAMEFQNLMNM